MSILAKTPDEWIATPLLPFKAWALLGYAGEDIAFVQAIKKVGRFVAPKPTVVTSAQKLDVVGPWELIGLLLRIAVRGSRNESKWVLDILYGRRAQDCRKPVKAA